LLALCKFVQRIKQTIEVTYKPTLEMGTSLAHLREGSLMSLGVSLTING
jgi:hypothetical protein